MKQITQLTGEVFENLEWNDPRGTVAALLDEPQPGYLRQIHLTGAGLLVKSGTVSIGIPLAALMALVEKCEPGLQAPATVETPVVTVGQAAQELAVRLKRKK